MPALTPAANNAVADLFSDGDEGQSLSTDESRSRSRGRGRGRGRGSRRGSNRDDADNRCPRKDRRRRRTRSEDSADAALNQGGNLQNTYTPRNITFLRGVQSDLLSVYDL